MVSVPFGKYCRTDWSSPRKSDTKFKGPLCGSIEMYSRSTLSHCDAVSAIELFEQGFAAKSVTIALDLAAAPV